MSVPFDHNQPAQPFEQVSQSAMREPIRLLRFAQVMSITGLRKTKIYELQANGDFPFRVQITAHSVGWVEEEIQAWLAKRVTARSNQSASCSGALSR